ncbi:hypothetical protein K2173_025057 [Erythroxylum novogranatense]|uniref:Uncharacterized protein n=1 Tax=Erythroxylum novogranatense TaxID=1862640 RepID=A0AAV8SW60_9ROSI|nr:hypothetical protein K2173_025057 [Erythroxylum novogranatense]
MNNSYAGGRRMSKYGGRQDSYSSEAENPYKSSSKLDAQWQWDRDRNRDRDRDAESIHASQMTSHVFNNQGPGGNETRHYYQGQTPDSKLSLENLVHKDGRSQPYEQDMEIGYDNTILPLSFEVLDRKFLDEILKLAKEHNEAEDAEIARHTEKIIQINTGYHEKLFALRVQQGNRREEFLRKESQTRLSQYQQAGLKHYSTTSMPDAHRYGGATVVGVADDGPQAYATNQLESYRGRTQFAGGGRILAAEGRISYPEGNAYGNAGGRYYQ